MRQRIAVAMAAALLLGACAKIVVVPVTKDLRGEGVFYALPRTVARVQVKVDRKVKTAAPFSVFAAIFAPDGTAVCDQNAANEADRCLDSAGKPRTKVSFAVQPGASISTFGEPDPTQIYMVRFAGGGTVDQTLSLTWNDAGLLSQAAATVTNRTTDVVVSGLKLAGGLGAKAGSFGAVRADGKLVQPSCAPEPASDSDGWVLAAIHKELEGESETEQLLVGNYCAIVPKDNVRIRHFPGDAELLQRATRAFVGRVKELFEARRKLLGAGSQALDPVPVVDKLDALIDAQFKALYLGTTATTTWDGSIDVRAIAPESVNTDLLLFKLHEKGICDVRQLTATLAPDSKPVPEDFLGANEGECISAAAKPVNLRLEYYPAKEQQLFTSVQSNVVEPPGERGFRYRVPAQVRARIGSDASATYGGGVFSVAQLGPTVSLPARRNSKALSYDLAFVEATGALKSFKLVGTGSVDAATVDALAGVGGTVLDARNASRQAAATAADELTVLTHQQALLKLKDEICTLQRKYGLDCTVQP